MSNKPNGAILYRGPSMLDGAPIVVIATGLTGKSRNAKTGDMVQTWILRDDVDPHDATKGGEDASICGDCVHRPALGGSCYVKVFQAPKSVWKAFQRGVYSEGLDYAVQAAAGRMVRLGSYGDPAAVPLRVWEAFTSLAEGWTGYTHQWRTAPAGFKPLVMASADSEAEGIIARVSGWRTFRVRTASEPILAKQEFMCPASEEAGRKTDCASCKACMGTESKARVSPVIIAHGNTARRFTLTRNGQIAA